MPTEKWLQKHEACQDGYNTWLDKWAGLTAFEICIRATTEGSGNEIQYAKWMLDRMAVDLSRK